MLGKVHRLIHAEGEEELPDGSVAAIYRFTHALYQNFLYDQLLSKRRVLLHRRAGETLERVYAGQHARVAGALATHFERGRDFVRAIAFLIQAGDTALSRYANAEAVSLFNRGLELVDKLPEGQQAERRAVLLHKRALAQMALGRLKEAGEDYRAMGEACLGLFYRYGLISANETETNHILNSLPEPLDATRSSGHSSEFGLRLRGPISRKLFYGVNASWLGLGLSDSLTRAIAVNSYQRDRARRTSAAFGLGYFLNQRTVLSLDLAGGTSLASTNRTQATGSLLLQTGAQHSWFGSANVGMQTNVSSHLFLNASYLYIGQTYDLSQLIYPDSYGNTVLITDPFLPLTATGYRPPRNSSDFGAGWRFSNNLFLQYMFSTSYGVDSGGHTLMLLYTIQHHRHE